MQRLSVPNSSLWKWAFIGSSVLLFGVLSLHERKKRLVYRYHRNWLTYLLKGKIKPFPQGNKVDDLVLASAILQAIERYLLPLTCTGVVLGEGLCGMLVLHPNGELVSAATTGERACPLHTCELLCLEDAAICLGQQAQDSDPKYNLSNCIFISTHRSSIVDMGLPLLKKCGVTKVYALFETSDYSKFQRDADEEGSVSTQLGTLPEGVLGRGDYKLVSGIEILPFSSLIGKVDTRAREFANEEDLKIKMALDQKKLKLQMRLLSINRTFQRLAKELRTMH